MNNILENRLCAEDLFSSLSNESEPPLDRNILIKSNKTLNSIINSYIKCVKKNNKKYFSITECYERCEKNIPKYHKIYDMNSFCLDFEKISEVKSYWHFDLVFGIYISSLINNCPENNIKINLLPNLRFNYLGYKNNCKNIEFYGDVSDELGKEMSGGRIDLYGNTRRNAGYDMSGGEIIIHGDAGDCLGFGMSGGIIRANIKNNCAIGNCMTGGEIHLNGNKPRILIPRNGDIYHNGLQIIKNGKSAIGDKIRCYLD